MRGNEANFVALAFHPEMHDALAALDTIEFLSLDEFKRVIRILPDCR